MKKKIGNILICMLVISIIVPSAATNILENVNKHNNIKSFDDVDWWPMYGHDPQHTGVSTSSAPNLGMMKWSCDTCSEIRFSSPVIVDNKLYIGTGEIGSKETLDFEKIKSEPVINILNKNKVTTQIETGGVFCIDVITGNKEWDFVTRGTVSSTPVVYNENVYILSSDSNTFRGELYCLDAETGVEQWNFNYTSLQTTPIIEDDNLYVTIADPYTGYGKLLCLAPSNGTEKWNHSMGYTNFSMLTAPAAYNSNVYYTSIQDSNYTVELNCVAAATGQQKWSSFLTTMELGFAVSSPVISEEKAFVMSLESHTLNETSWSVLSCFDAENGDEIWTYAMPEFEISISTPAVANDIVYFPYVENYWAYGGLACVNASNGGVIWDQKLYTDFFIFSSPSIADEKLYIGTMSTYEYASVINCYNLYSGAPIWSYNIGELGQVTSSPAIADEKVFIASPFGKIFAFDDESPKIPDLDCSGTLSWTDVTPGDIVSGSITVENIGDIDSFLDWQIDSYPDWGDWSFDPDGGDDLLAGDSIIVDVEVVAPDEQEETFTGEIKIINSENSSDFCIIDVSLATPVSQFQSHQQVLRFLLSIIEHYPLLRQVLGL